MALISIDGSIVSAKNRGVLGKFKLQPLQATSALMRLFRIVYKMGKLMQPLSQYQTEVATHVQNSKCTHAKDTMDPVVMCGSSMSCPKCRAQLSFG